MKVKKQVVAVNSLDATDPQVWKKTKYISAELKEQLDQMDAAEIKKAFANEQLDFGTAGIRAKMGPGTQYLNTYTYRQIMIGYCKYILSRPSKTASIIIAHDNRRNSHEFALECANVAVQMGVNVHLVEDNEVLPTPLVSYAIRKFKLSGGVNITASHNPKEDNGFKAYNSLGAQVLPDEAKIIKDNMPPSRQVLNLTSYLTSKRRGKTSYINYDQLVTNFFEAVIKKTIIDKTFLLPRSPIKNFPIIFTGFHGTTTKLIPDFLNRLGFKKVFVYPKHATISGEFEDCPISNPEDPKAFDDIKEFANSKKSTLIIGCDPDGDRMAMCVKKTNRWRVLNGNEMGIIFAHYILTHKQFRRTPVIMTTHVSASYVDRIAKKAKAQVIRTKTGFKWMCNQIDSLPSKNEFVIGFEEAIGSLVHDVCRDKDSFGAVLLSLEILHHGNAFFPDLHDYLCDRIYDVYGPTHTETHSYTIHSENWKEDAKKMMDRALNFKQKDIFDYHIEKIWYQKEADAVVWTLNKDSWIKFRLSGTEPKFKVYVNFNNQMSGQLKSAAIANIDIIEKSILQGFKYKK